MERGRAAQIERISEGGQTGEALKEGALCQRCCNREAGGGWRSGRGREGASQEGGMTSEVTIGIKVVPQSTERRSGRKALTVTTGRNEHGIRHWGEK